MAKFIIIVIILIILACIVPVWHKKQKKKSRKKKLYADAATVLNILRRDWQNSDAYFRVRHVSTYREKGVLVYKYITMKGETIYMIGNHILAHLHNRRIHFQTDEVLKQLFKNFANETINFVNKQNKGYTNTNNKGNSNKGNTNSKGNTNNRVKNPNANHPKWNVYQTLLTTAKSRRDQLSKLSVKSAGRDTLQNELNAVEGRIKIFKEKYKF